MPLSNGLGGRVRLTQSSYRDAVSETVRDLQDGATDQDMADAWGVSASTVGNARNRGNDLAAMNLLRIGDRFGPPALDTVLALIGARAVRRDEVTVDVARVPCDVAKTLPLLIDLLSDGECSVSDVRKLDDAGAIDCLIRVADMLRDARDRMRLQAV
ncbi:MAG: hypothetical protein DI530_15075 [Sphingomonas sp.]|uniref:hypothetical protein n=1 Tax=Sphingomonas sp. TaxID=28214 RepID=UPI000DBBF57E|nr:hypothetical protein [Sphingomonas sp.]PZU75573.1 MAG: hypothetical protein DI530_15075 [Sphingomonas sp.]